MKKLALALLVIVVATNFCLAQQQQYYDVTAGNGNGLRLWGSDTYKIHMGYGAEYSYGPVTDYSIKTNMSGGISGRGWTWGVSGATPVAAINILGNMQIAGSFTTGGDIILPSLNGNKQIYTWSSGDANWRIGMSQSPGFTTSMATSHVQYLTYFTGPGQGFAVGVNGGQSSFEITGSNHNAFFRGNVGIGTISPDAKLAVSGQVHSQEVKVSVTVPGPDYVFEKSYNLPTLEEIKTYIDQNKHLPEVPSAAEMEKNGVKLGEMNMLLLKKVEELTLYVIEANRKIKAQDERIDWQQKEIKSLKTK